MAYAIWAAFQHGSLRQAAAAEPKASAISRQSTAIQTPSLAAVAALFGFSGAGSGTAGTRSESVRLAATFVGNRTASRALLITELGEHLYTEGDPLPGGGVLRRVQANGVVLWRNDQEQWLVMSRPRVPQLLPHAPGTPRALNVSRFQTPSIEQASPP